MKTVTFFALTSLISSKSSRHNLFFGSTLIYWPLQFRLVDLEKFKKHQHKKDNNIFVGRN